MERLFKDRVTQSPVHRMAYSRDWSPVKTMPLTFRYRRGPKTTEEVVHIAQIALRYEIPIVPFGGGTGMGGGVTAWKGGIMVETKG